MRLRIGYLLLAFGLLALIVLTVVRMGRERQFYELQLRQQATAIEAGLREKWKEQLLAVAKHDKLPKDFILRWDRAGKVLRTPFYPEPGIQLEWAEFREASKKADILAEKNFLEKALLLRRSWDRVLAFAEWQRVTGEAPKLELEGYERTVIDPEAREAFRAIISQVESGRDFTFARNDADFDQIFFRTTPDGELEAFLPAIDSLRTEILPTFLAQNRLSNASFGATALDIHFPEFQNIAANGLHGVDTLLLTASAILLAIGVGLTATGVREQRNILLRRVSFLNQVVHELKTPLAGLRLSAQLIRRSGPSERNLQAIDESIMRLDRLFDDIVQINRAEKPADLSRVSHQELNSLINTLCSTEFAGTAIVDGAATAPLMSEIGRLRVMLRNLFSNGVKYGDRIVVSIRETGDRTEITVRDQGPGVALKDAPKIFDEFFRAESARKIESGGLGLGLSLVKKLATELHASVKLANPGATGAIFVVSLPRAKYQEPS
jgi:signal transduction histidine kinase